ncbi:MAG: hypothetical protein ACOC41_07290 [Chitinivibrionales bacterium]
MQKINRIAIVVKGRQPLVDWINQKVPDEKISLEDVRSDCNVLLIPDGYEHTEAIEMVEQNFEAVFLSEMEGWFHDETMWPKDITLTKFRKWFELEYHSVIFDVLEESIEKEENL